VPRGLQFAFTLVGAGFSQYRRSSHATTRFVAGCVRLRASDKEFNRLITYRRHLATRQAPETQLLRVVRKKWLSLEMLNLFQGFQ
jgi:hypothetical protein